MDIRLEYICIHIDIYIYEFTHENIVHLIYVLGRHVYTVVKYKFLGGMYEIFHRMDQAYEEISMRSGGRNTWNQLTLKGHLAPA